MTTPASGAISFGNIVTEFNSNEGDPYWGLGPSGTAFGLDFLRDEILGAGSGSIALGTSFYSKTCVHGTAASSITGANWVNPGNVCGNTEDTYYELLDNVDGDALIVTNWGFSVPSNKTIRGVQVAAGARWYDNYGSDGSPAIWFTIWLTKNGSSSVGNGHVLYPYYDSGIYQQERMPVGSGTDAPMFRSLWGTTLSYTDVNSTNFGVYIVPSKFGGDAINACSLYLSYLRLRVHYD